jgi:hypothetical protein
MRVIFYPLPQWIEKSATGQNLNNWLSSSIQRMYSQNCYELDKAMFKTAHNTHTSSAKNIYCYNSFHFFSSFRQ